MLHKAWEPIRAIPPCRPPHSTGQLVALALLLISLSACTTVGPDYAAPAAFAPEAWQQAARHPQRFNLEPAADLSQWWRQLDDPLLSDLIARALAASPDLQGAQARLRAARARLGVAEAAQAPTLGASATASRSKSGRQTGGGPARELYSVGFDASWEIDLFGGAARAAEAAGADYQASAADLQDVQVSLAAEVARAYAAYRNLELRGTIAARNLDTQSETLQIASWRQQAGLVGALDVEQARGNREQTRALLPQLDSARIEAEHRLAVLLGQAPGSLHAELAGRAGSLRIAPKVALGIPAELLRRRPDLRAAERRLAAETARVGSATAALYPSLRLTGSLGLDSLSVPGLARSGAAGQSLLASLGAPIFNAGLLRQQVALQDAAREQALQSYRKTLLTALGEVENALAALDNSEQRSAALESAADAARNAAGLAQNQYAAGLVDFQSVLNTQRTLLSVEDNLALARQDSLLALITLYKALGGGWQADAAAPDTAGNPP
jgi:outer membrane protein, multidrug efflux system